MPDAHEPPVLRIRFEGRELLGQGQEPITVGRGYDVAVRIDHELVSRAHARLKPGPGGWVLEDLGSRNGLYERGERVRTVRVNSPTSIRLGHPDRGPLLELIPSSSTPPKAPPRQAFLTTRANPSPPNGAHLDPTTRWDLGQPDAVHRIGASAVRIGRTPDNDIVVDDLSVSRSHAAVRGNPVQGFRLLDLGSHNGTFLNGRRVAEAPLREYDLIGVGHTTLRLVGDRLEAFTEAAGERLEVAGCGVTTPEGKVLLDEVGFALEGCSLLAVVGPSGAGKSTLLKALTGVSPATRGTVSYGGRDLYDEYDELRLRIGYVPQDDILHPQLTVRRALEYAAELRFGSDVSRADRRRRVDEVLNELGLAERAGLVVSKLSGGQRKRVNVAMELLTGPSLLFLDEPTSGLDPGYEKAVTRLLRELADGGRTVVVVTHSLASLSLCDRVLFLAPGGRTAIFGPPDEALAFFGADDFADVFAALDRDREAQFAARFRASPEFERYVGEPLGARRAARAAPARTPRPPAPPPRRGRVRQLSSLTRRYLSVLFADRRNLGVLLLQAPVLGLLMLRVMGSGGLGPAPGGVNPETRKVLLTLVLTATWLGASNSVREIVKELPVYRRERSIGLSATAYVASKALVLSVLTVAQTAVFTLIATLAADGPADGAVLGSPMLELIAGVALAGLAAMALGLCISALVDNADKALSFLPLLLVPQLVLSGALFELRDRPELNVIGWLASARWGYGAVAATAGLRELEPLRCSELDPAAGNTVGCAEPWGHTAGAWVTNVVALGILIGLGLLLARLALRRQDPRRRALPARLLAGAPASGPPHRLPHPGPPPGPYPGPPGWNGPPPGPGDPPPPGWGPPGPGWNGPPPGRR